jgi:hypothetical protein
MPADAQPQQTKELIEWQQDDAKAASIIAWALSKFVAELVFTCTNAKDIWDKLCARFERSSTQRLNMLFNSSSRRNVIARTLARMSLNCKNCLSI